jgi:uncharacterized Rmd1/YagE family protein
MSSASLNQYLSLYTWSPGAATFRRGGKPTGKTKTKTKTKAKTKTTNTTATATTTEHNRNRNHDRNRNHNHNNSQQPRRSESAVARCTATVYKAKYLLKISKG